MARFSYVSPRLEFPPPPAPLRVCPTQTDSRTRPRRKIGGAARDAPARKRSKRTDWSVSSRLSRRIATGWLAWLFRWERSRCLKARSEPSGHDRCESLRHRASRLVSDMRGQFSGRIRGAGDEDIQVLHGERASQTSRQQPQQQPERLLRQTHARWTDARTGCYATDHFHHAAVVENIVDFVLHVLVQDCLLNDINHITDMNVGRDRTAVAGVEKTRRTNSASWRIDGLYMFAPKTIDSRLIIGTTTLRRTASKINQSATALVCSYSPTGFSSVSSVTARNQPGSWGWQ